MHDASIHVNELTSENTHLRNALFVLEARFAGLQGRAELLQSELRAAEAERDEARELHAAICERVARLESQYRDICQAHDKALSLISRQGKAAV